MKTVLVIEDNHAVLKTISDILSTLDLKVSLVTNGEDGLDFARKHVPDLVISDISLPGINGYDVLKEIRGNNLTTHVPVILLTAKIERDEVRRGMELGANDYITKPFQAEELINSVKMRLQIAEKIVDQRQETLKQLRNNIVYALPHELRTPLMHILGYADLLMLDNETVPHEQIQGWGQQIRKAGERLQRLIENYLVYIQIETLLADPVRCETVRQQLTENAGLLIKNNALVLAAEVNRQHDLRLNLDDATLKISSTDLQKILEELLDNALKFSRPETAISIIGRKNGRNYELRIRDFGRGMDAEMVHQMGAYMQFQRDLYEQQGVGLGFSIAQKLVSLYEGRLDVESEVNQGTLVSVTLPLDTSTS